MKSNEENRVFIFVVLYSFKGPLEFKKFSGRFIIMEESTLLGNIEDRVLFVEEVANPNSTRAQPDIKTLPSPRLLKTHLSYEAIPRAKKNNTSCKYIYLARNPIDTAVSSYKFIKKLWICNRIECSMGMLREAFN